MYIVVAAAVAARSDCFGISGTRAVGGSVPWACGNATLGDCQLIDAGIKWQILHADVVS